ncbi:MAG TPA: hypothetical protein DEP82_14360 [Arthrobacter bacterium]|nr:hypothetical protein [Arthrobacter sp.]
MADHRHGAAVGAVAAAVSAGTWNMVWLGAQPELTAASYRAFQPLPAPVVLQRWSQSLTVRSQHRLLRTIDFVNSIFQNLA